MIKLSVIVETSRAGIQGRVDDESENPTLEELEIFLKSRPQSLIAQHLERMGNELRAKRN